MSLRFADHADLSAGAAVCARGEIERRTAERKRARRATRLIGTC